jgi:hypothetical protein
MADGAAEDVSIEAAAVGYFENRANISKVLAVLFLILWILALVALVSDYEQTPMYKFAKIDELNAPYLAFMRVYYGVNADSKADFKYSLADLGCDMVDASKQTDVKKWDTDANTEQMRVSHPWKPNAYVVPQKYRRGMAGVVARTPSTVNHDSSAKIDATPYHAWTNGLFKNEDPVNGTVGTVQLSSPFAVDFKVCFKIVSDVTDYNFKVVLLLSTLALVYIVSHIGAMGKFDPAYMTQGYEMLFEVVMSIAVPVLLSGMLAYLGNYILSQDYDKCNRKLGLGPAHVVNVLSYIVMIIAFIVSLCTTFKMLTHSSIILDTIDTRQKPRKSYGVLSRA